MVIFEQPDRSAISRDFNEQTVGLLPLHVQQMVGTNH
jgi:hypothetical protein